MSRKSFILYNDEMRDTLSELDDNEAGQLIKGIVAYELSREDASVIVPQFDDRALRMSFNRITSTLDRDAIKWAAKSKERVNAGRKGGIKSGETRRQKSAKREANEAIASSIKQDGANEAVNGSVSDNVNVNANGSGSDTAAQRALERAAASSDLEEHNYYGFYNNVPLTDTQCQYLRERLKGFDDRIDKASRALQEKWRGYGPEKSIFEWIVYYAKQDGKYDALADLLIDIERKDPPESEAAPDDAIVESPAPDNVPDEQDDRPFHYDINMRKVYDVPELVADTFKGPDNTSAKHPPERLETRSPNIKQEQRYISKEDYEETSARLEAECGENARIIFDQMLQKTGVLVAQNNEPTSANVNTDLYIDFVLDEYERK